MLFFYRNERIRALSTLRRFLGWSVVTALCLFPLIVYGALPYVLEELVKWQLTQQGFTNANIAVGYPDLHALPIDHISLAKETPIGVIELTIRKGVVTYQLSQLSLGHISHIFIPDATIRVIPSPPSSVQDKPIAVTTQSALTLKAFIQPLPPMPFDQVAIDSLLIVHHESKNPLHELVVAGTLQQHNGNVQGNFTMKGPHTPTYKMSIDGKNIGNIDMALSLSGVTPTKVWESHVQATVLDDSVQVTGRLAADIQELNTFLSLIIPVPNEARGASGHITVNWQGVGLKDSSLDSLRHDARSKVSGTFQLQGKVPHLHQSTKDLTLNLFGSFTAGSKQVAWALSPQSSVIASLDVKTIDLPAQVSSLLIGEELPLVFSVSNGLQGVLRNKDAGLYMEVHNTGCVQINPAKAPLSVQLCLADWQGFLNNPVQAEGTYALSMHVPKTRVGQGSFDRSIGEVHGKIGLHGGNVEISLDPKSTVTMMSTKMKAALIPSATLNVQEPVMIHYELKSKHLTMSPGVLKLDMPFVVWKKTKVALQGVTLAVNTFRKDTSSWAVQGTVDIRGVSTTMNTQTPPVTHWTVDIVLDPSEVFAKIFARTDENTIRAKARLTHSWKTNRGVFQAKVLPIAFSPAEFLLSQTLQPWTYPVDIVSGKLSALAHIFWKTSSDPQESSIVLEPSEVEIGAHHLSGHFKKVIFQDVSMGMNLRGTQEWVTTKPGSISIKQIHSGIDVSDILGQVHAVINPFTKAYRVEMNRFSSRLFGGTVRSPEMVFDSTRPQQKLTLHVQGVQVEELVQLEQQQGLQGTGLLDGVIPLTLGKNGIEVNQGHLEARAPGGVIRYHSAEETLGSLSHLGPQMELVIDALENFKYHVLRAGVDYQKDGTLNLRMRLEGKNPDLQHGRPIHVNFNLEENIPSLLKSLAVVRGIEKDIERMVNYPLRNTSGN